VALSSLADCAPMHSFQSIQFAAAAPGPRLLVTGAVHGNEVCGTIALRRLVAEFERDERRLLRGLVTFVPITNPLAYERQQRNGDRNLNRRLQPTDSPQQFEDHVANWLCPLMSQHQALLDLHSFQAQGTPFVMVGPENNEGALQRYTQAAEELAWAKVLGVGRAVDGWLDTYAGGVAQRRARFAGQAVGSSVDLDENYGVGTTEQMRRLGGMALTLECGQHEDPQGPEVAYRAIVNTLLHFGLIEGEAPAVQSMAGLHLHHVEDREHPDDQFAKAWTSFDRLQAGELIGRRASGEEVRAPGGDWQGCIVFPNTKAQPGQEWFYLAQVSERFR
jgi:uncharacterized protein